MGVGEQQRHEQLISLWPWSAAMFITAHQERDDEFHCDPRARMMDGWMGGWVDGGYLQHWSSRPESVLIRLETLRLETLDWRP